MAAGRARAQTNRNSMRPLNRKMAKPRRGRPALISRFLLSSLWPAQFRSRRGSPRAARAHFRPAPSRPLSVWPAQTNHQERAIDTCQCLLAARRAPPPPPSSLSLSLASEREIEFESWPNRFSDRAGELIRRRWSPKLNFFSPSSSGAPRQPTQRDATPEVASLCSSWRRRRRRQSAI